LQDKRFPLEYLLFVFYLVLFAWLVTRVKFFTKTGLSKPQLIILFLLKIMAGIFYGWIGTYYGGLAQMYDTWVYHNQGIVEYNLLFTHPGQYFTNLFHNPYENGVKNFLESSGSYWNDLKGNMFIKIVSIFNILSFGNYYVNVIIYSFVSLFGPIAIYRVMMDVFPKRKTTLLLFSFLIPSFLYWTSGLHKEGLLFTGIGIITYILYFGLKEKKWSIARVLIVLVWLVLILALRNFVIIVLIPALLTWLIASRWPQRTARVFIICYLLFGILFFTSKYISSRLDFPQAVVNKQLEFMKLQGATSVPIKTLEPTAASFLKNTPQAINLSLIRPYPADVKHILSLAAAIEINALLLILILFLFFRNNGITNRQVLFFLFFLGFSLLLSIGFSQSNLGAIVRYRSIVLPLLVIPIAAMTDWERIKLLVNKYTKS
jgi:hypothetical protein